MKKSNLVIFLFAIVFFSGSFILKKPTYRLSASVGNRVFSTQKVDHFSVIVAQPGSRVTVRAPYPVVEYPSYSSSRDRRFFLPPSFVIRDDTLFLFACSIGIEYSGDTFYCKRIRSIVGMEKSDIHLSYLQADTLNIKLNHSKLFADFDTRNKFLKQINIQADSSKIDLRAVAFEDVNLLINRSHLKLETSFVKSKVKGTLKNYSGLYIVGRPEVETFKDETSFSNM